MLITAAESDLHPYKLKDDEREAVAEAQAQGARG